MYTLTIHGDKIKNEMDVLKRILSPTKYLKILNDLNERIMSNINFNINPIDADYVFKVKSNQTTINWLLLAGIDIQKFEEYQPKTLNAGAILKKIRENEDWYG